MSRKYNKGEWSELYAFARQYEVTSHLQQRGFTRILE